MVILQPSHIVDDRIGSGLDTAVVSIDGFMPGDLGVLEKIRKLGFQFLQDLIQGLREWVFLRIF